MDSKHKKQYGKTKNTGKYRRGLAGGAVAGIDQTNSDGDVDGRKDAGRLLEATNRRLTAIIEFFPDATFVIDSNRTIIAWNRAIEEMTGVPKREMIGRTFDAVSVLFYGKKRPILADAVLRGGTSKNHKYDSLTQIGRTFFIETYVPALFEGRGAYIWAKASPLLDENGKLDGVVESIRDITEQKQLMERVNKSEKEYRELVDGAPIGVFRTKLDGTILFSNPAWAAMYGYTREEMMQMNARSLYHDSEDRDDYIDKLVDKGQTMEYIKHFVSKEGKSVFSMVRSRLEGDVISGVNIDITERVLMQRALKESERNLSQILEGAPLGIMVHDKTGKCLLLNKKALEITGYTLDDVPVGRVWFHKAYPDESYRREAIRIWKDDVTGEPLRRVFRVRTNSGADRYLEFLVVRIQDEKTVTTFSDITERMEMQKRLLESEERYRIAIEHSNDGVAIIRGDEHLYVSRRFLEMFGYESAEEFPRHPAYFTVHPSEREKILEMNRKRQAGESVPGRYVFTGVKKDGSIIYVDVSATQIMYQGRPATLAYLRDITERKEAEERLRASEAELRALFEAMTDVVFVVDKQGTFLKTAPTAAPAMTDVEGGINIVGKCFYDLFPEDEARFCVRMARRCLRKGIPITVEHHGPANSPVRRWLMTTVSPFGKNAVVWVSRDITELKEMEEELRKKSSSLEETVTALKVLVTHVEETKQEFEKSIVSNIKNLIYPYIEKLKRQRLDTMQRTYIEIIDRNLQNVSSPLLTDMVQFALTPTEIQIANLIRDGKSTKEIAEILRISIRSAELHRFHIREKLGLNNAKANLRSFLLSNQQLHKRDT